MPRKLVCYSVAKLPPTKHRTFHREMYGYKDISNKGKYVYKRKGAISRIKCRKIFNGVIITNEEGLKVIMKILRKYKLKNRVFDILLKHGT